MSVEPGIAIAVAVPLLSAVIWLVRLEGRINLADERHADLKADIAEIKSDVRKIRAFMGGGVDRP